MTSPPPDQQGGGSRALLRAARGRPSAPAEVALLLLALLLFALLHSAMGEDIEVATANARTVRSVESVLHLDFELSVNRWLTQHPVLIQPAVHYYRLYYVVILGVLLWTYLRHAEVYLRARRTLLAMITLVLPVYWLVPLSPPRFSLPGVVDVVAENDLLGSHASTIAGGQSLSAMPSMHVGWSLWCAYAAWSALRPAHPRLAPLPWLFPLGMVVTVFVTGNHYVLDVVGSVVLLAASIGTAALWGRLAARWRQAP